VNNPMLKVVLDTNVIVSALNFSGSPSKVLELAVKGDISNVISRYILQEVEEVLVRKFSWELSEAHNAAIWLTLFSKVVAPKKRLNVIADDPDNRILECAMAGKADFIVSGDRHLKDLKTFRGIRIVDPAAFLQIAVE
jgi:uncharacterized protein